MELLALILAVVALALAGKSLLARRRKSRARRSATASEVHRQHVYLFQGGHLSEATVESTRVAFEHLLDLGDVAQLEASLNPGTRFVAQVRALTEIGTESAGAILERQLRRGVQPHVVALGRLGDLVETAWHCRREPIDSPAVRVFVEALRLVRRADHAERLFGQDESKRAEFRAQVDRMTDLSDVLIDYLDEAPEALLHALAVETRERADILRALIDLKTDTAAVVIPLLDAEAIDEPELAVASLAHSTEPGTGPWLCRRIAAEMKSGRRGRWAFPLAEALR